MTLSAVPCDKIVPRLCITFWYATASSACCNVFAGNLGDINNNKNDINKSQQPGVLCLFNTTADCTYMYLPPKPSDPICLTTLKKERSCAVCLFFPNEEQIFSLIKLHKLYSKHQGSLSARGKKLMSNFTVTNWEVKRVESCFFQLSNI